MESGILEGSNLFGTLIKFKGKVPISDKKATGCKMNKKQIK